MRPEESTSPSATLERSASTVFERVQVKLSDDVASSKRFSLMPPVVPLPEQCVKSLVNAVLVEVLVVVAVLPPPPQLAIIKITAQKMEKIKNV